MTDTLFSTAAYADVNGLRMYYEIHGSGGTPLVVLHGELVAVATHFRSDGYHPEIRKQPDVESDRRPTAEEFQVWQAAYDRVAPDPDHFFAFVAKASIAPDDVDGWSEAELRAITARTLLVIADNDFVRLDHAAAMRDLIAGAQLAVVPGSTHTGMLRRTDILIPLVESFLSEQKG